MLEDHRALKSILRSDIYAFARKCFEYLHPGTEFQGNWHLEAFSYELECVLSGKNKRLIVNVPPRSLKSFFISIVFPAFILGITPHRKIVCVSYSQELADTHAANFRRIVQSDWYRELFQCKLPLKDTEAEYQTVSGGCRIATSVDGTITGRGGDFIIIDDPLSAADAYSKTRRDAVKSWYASTIATRLDHIEKGVIIVVMQRFHQDDLSGYLLESRGWRHLKLPAIAPSDMEVCLSATNKHVWKAGTALHEARLPLSELASLKKQMGTDYFNAQYLQEPVPEFGNLLKRHWLRIVDVIPTRQEGDEIVQSWDTAMKATETSDYSVCLTFSIRNNNGYHLIDIYRERPEFPELAKLVVSHAQKFGATTILIEDRVSGTSLIQVAKRSGLQGVNGVKSTSDKVARMHGQTPKLEAGSLILPKSLLGLDDFIIEYLAFPKGRHDDQVDALSQFLEWRVNRENNLFEFDFGYDDVLAPPSPDYILRRRGRG